MRLFEIVFLAVLSAGLVFTPVFHKGKNHWYFISCLLLIFLLHVWVEGLRWQMGMSYVLALISAWRVFTYSPPKGRKIWQVMRMGGVILLLIFACVPLILMPMFTLPKPGGNYAVGSEWVYMTDTSRPEDMTAHPTDKRELMIKFWYPAQPGTHAAMEPYLTKASRDEYARKYGLPAFALSHLDRVKSNVYEKAEPTAGPHPVILFSHGYSVPSDIYYALLTELASQGYFVVSLNHTYESTVSTFPDGRLVKFSDSASAAFHKQIPVRLDWEALANIDTIQSTEKRRLLLGDFIRYFPSTLSVRRWAADMSFVLDELEKLNSNPDSRYYKNFDLSKVGALGHSMGGATAGQIALFDKRVLAAVNMDGTQHGDMIDSLLTKPFMMISAKRKDFDPNPYVFVNKSTSWFYDIIIDGMKHGDFMDVPYYLGLSLGLTGSIEPDRGTAIVSQLTQAFFDQFLRNQPAQLPEIAKRYHEVELKTYRAKEQITSNE